MKCANTFVRVVYIYIYIYKRDSLDCDAGLAETLCPLEAPGVTLINYKRDNISIYVCPTVIIDFARKITKFVNFFNFDA